jgi:GMP synthase (glutamine-hydrolysing)
MARVVLIRHGDEPDDDRVVTYFRFHGIEPEIRKPFKGETLGAVDSAVIGSVLYGGPFNVFEEARHPFLYDENRWIEQCIARDVPLLGICQGGQSIAHVLGAPVGPRPGEPHEFGYYEIHATETGRDYFPDSLVVAQSHFHEFQLPAGAELLAGSDAFPQQAFRYGAGTFAFQFHAEQTPAGFRRWQSQNRASYGRPGAQTREQQDALMAEHDRSQHGWFMSFLHRLFGPGIAASRDQSAR